MKRFYKVLGIILIVLVAVGLLLPVLFKGEIEEKAKGEINKNLTATVNFKEVGVNLFSAFPNFLVSIEELTVDGQGDFEGLRLVELGNFELELDLWSVLLGSQFEIESIKLENTTVNVRVKPDGTANYDIVKSTESATPETAEADTATGSFKLALRHYALENFNLNYLDEEGEIKAVIKNLNHSGDGDFTQAVVNLNTQTSIEALTVQMEEVAYLKQVAVQSDFALSYNQETEKLTLGENHLDLNNLVLNFSGALSLPDKAGNMDLDLKFNTPENSFKSLLSLIPAIFTQDFSSLTASGNFSLQGAVQGAYRPEAEEYPAFDLNLAVNEGSFQYPSLPAGVEQVMVDLSLSNTSSQLDGTEIHLKKATARIANNPLEASFHLVTPLSDPDFSAQLKTKLQLENLAKVVPAQGYDYAGTLEADFSTAGRLSHIEREQYEKVQAQGYLKATAISLKGDSLPMPIQIPVAEMNLSPQKVSLDQFKAQFGSSDLQANGSLTNLMSYVLSDELLSGTFSLQGQRLNLNELGSTEGEEPAAESTATTDTSALSVIRLPQNIAFGLTASLDTVLYQDLQLTQLRGQVLLKEGQAQLQDVRVNGLGGAMVVNGSYNSVPQSPEVDFNFKLQNLSFQESFRYLNTVQQLAPIMKNTTGTYSMGLNFTSLLNPDMSPDLASVFAKGSLETSRLETESKVLTKISTAVKNPKLAQLSLAGVDLNFTVKDGRLSVEPFDIKAGAIRGSVAGSNGLDQSLDYVMDLKVPLKGIGAQNLLNQLGAAQSGNVDLKVNIGGTMTQPKISTSLGDLAKNVVDNLKDQAKEKVEELKQEATDKVNKEAQKLVEEASKKGDELIKAAEAQAQKIRDEAAKQAQRIKDEAYKRADKIEKEAEGNILKETAAKATAKGIRDQADKQAQKVIDEADKQANNLVQKAKDEKQKLVNEAKAKAQI